MNVSDEAAQLTRISERLEEVARSLRDDSLEGEEASRLAGECAELASQAAAELERLARTTPDDALPGQEGLL
jgi:hypothetical protein